MCIPRDENIATFTTGSSSVGHCQSIKRKPPGPKIKLPATTSVWIRTGVISEINTLGQRPRSLFL